MSDQLTLNTSGETRFSINIEGFSGVTYFAQEVTLPGISSQEIFLPTANNRIPLGCDHIDWEPLTFTFLVDEYHDNWFKIFDWMCALAAIKNPTDSSSKSPYTEYFKTVGKKEGNHFNLSKSVILFINSAKNNLIRKVSFFYCFPHSLSTVQLNSSSTEDRVLVATCSCSYFQYEHERIGE